MAVLVLLATQRGFDGGFDAPLIVGALLVFALTFPGKLRSAGTGPMALAGEILSSWAVTAGLLLLLGWATDTLDAFESEAILVWLLATPALQFAAHRVAPLLVARALAGGGERRAAIVGAGALGQELGRRIAANPLLGLRVLGFFDDRSAERLGGAALQQRPRRLAELGACVREEGIDVIYVMLPMCSQPRIRGLLDELRDTTASIYFVPDMLLFDPIQARVDLVAGLPVIAVCESPFHGVQAFVKRGSDLVLASIALLLFAPLMLAIAWGVKRSSPGPVIFRQRRHGMDGREIVVYKFRTMTCVEDDGQSLRQATRDDPRVTRLGALLRRYSLDELPQFVNVLQGRMSVVGPRPHALAHNTMYRKLVNGYMLRHKVRPGITGLAQVSGLRGETDTVEKMRLRVESDLDYLRHWSLSLDLRIVLKTILVVLGKDDQAY